MENALIDSIWFVAEVLGEGLPSRRANKVELEVAVLHGRLNIGPALVVSNDLQVRQIAILGVPTGTPPAFIAMGNMRCLVDGISSSDIRDGQLLIQGFATNTATKSTSDRG